jgi:hypothetical protein
MSALDDALQKFIDDPETGQGPYYDQLLNTEFYIPLSETPQEDEPQNVAPMILESDGKHYMMLFDSVERLNSWAEQEAAHAIYVGYQLAELTPDSLCWAINVGSDHGKEIVPEELAMLKQAVAAYRESEGEEK